jgi:hypothetical protein
MTYGQAFSGVSAFAGPAFARQGSASDRFVGGWNKRCRPDITARVESGEKKIEHRYKATAAGTIRRAGK